VWSTQGWALLLNTGGMVGIDAGASQQETLSLAVAGPSLDLLASVLDSNPGEVQVSFVVQSEGEGDVVVQIPRTRIRPTRELVAAIDSIEGVLNVRLTSKAAMRPRRGAENSVPR